MRGLFVLLVVLSGCRSTRPEGGEVSREECAELVRHVQKLESEDTGGLRLALGVGMTASVDGCLEKATRRAYACVMQSASKKDLESCDMLMK
jgi:hypothetical protein